VFSKRLLSVLIACLLAGGAAFGGSPPDPVVDEYVEARARQDEVSYSVDMVITASIPSMGKVGRLRATRRHSDHGSLNYEQMRFEGDNLIKTNVIARYLSAEVEAQKPEAKLATQISPANYEFKQKGSEHVEGRQAVVFEVKPRKKRNGLFKGLIWVDAATRQPIKEVGKLAKLPSIWLKEISFVREYTNVNGLALPARITSKIKTRIIGEAHVTIDFENYRVDGQQEEPLPLTAGLAPELRLPSRLFALYGPGAPLAR